VGVFLKLHKISQSLDYWQIIMGVVIGFTLQAGISAYGSNSTDLPVINDTFVNQTVEDVKTSVNSSVSQVKPDYPKVSIRELSLNTDEYMGENISIEGEKALGAVLVNGNGASFDVNCDTPIDMNFGENYVLKGQVKRVPEEEYLGEEYARPQLVCHEPPTPS